MNIAVIPARGGSKRIPRKNIKDFCGRPMITWSIKAAQDSGLFERIVVSTDDAEIRETALEHGAEVPFLRPAELSDDHTPTIPVIRHAVEWFKEYQQQVKYVCCIYATAPFLQPRFLREGIELLKRNHHIQFVFSVTPFNYPIFRAIKLGTAEEVGMFWPEHELKRSQDLPRAFHDAGQFYWGTVDAWLKCNTVFSSVSRAVVLPPHLVQDIDNPEDWLRAELMWEAFQRIPHV